MPFEVDVPHVPLYHFLQQAAARYPSSPALRFESFEMTYADLLRDATAFARGLQELGVRPGARVMLLLPNTPQIVIALYGALMAGAVVALANPAADGLAALIRDADTDTVMAVGRALPAVVEASPRTIIRTRVREYLPPLRSRLITLFGDRDVEVPGAVDFADLLARHRDQPFTAPAANPDDVAVLAYTGGTTGRPRAVMLTHRNLVANALQVRAFYTEAREGREVLLAALPFWHSYGLTAGLNLSVYLAGCLLLVPDFRPTEALRQIQRYRPSLFPGVPAMYVSLINHPKVKEHRFSKMHAISGAAALPVEVKEAFERLGKGKLVEGYGLTEAGPVTHANPLGQAGRAGCIGVPLPSTEARVVDPASGHEVAPGEVGEMQVRGPQVMRGYWGRPEDTRKALRDGWLSTGDLVTMDEDGYFRVICRRVDVIPTERGDLYPRDVEEVLYEHPAVREAAVTGEDGELVAHVALRRGGRTDEADLLRFCRGRLSPWKVPARVVLHEKLPRSSVGKILRRLL